jgi:secretion/DNA translocation related CpaE-like protein
VSTLLPDTGPPGRPLVVTAAEPLLDDLLRVLAAAGCDAEVATGGPALRRGHREAPLVLVGADVLGAAAVRTLPRRPGVLVVTRGELAAEGWAAAVALGAERVVALPEDEPWLLSRAAGAGRRPVHRGWLAAVGGCCGGAGASSLAVALALSAAPRSDVVLVDGDGVGGGLDLLLGAESVPGLRWPDLAALRGRVDGGAVAGALPEAGGIRVLAAARDPGGPVPGAALAAVVEGLRAAGRAVVVDLPRSADGAEAVLAEADLAVLVVPARLRAACAARSLLSPGSSGAPPWAAAHLVVRRQPGGLSVREVVELVGRPVLAELGHDAAAVPRAERGQLLPTGPRSVWGAAGRRLLAELTEDEAVPA